MAPAARPLTRTDAAGATAPRAAGYSKSSHGYGGAAPRATLRGRPNGVPSASTGEAMLRRMCGRPSSRPRSPWCWWAHAAAATHGADCVEQHMHSLLWSVAVVLKAVELVSEVTGSDPYELARRRLLFAKDYDRDMLEPRLFRQRLGARYLATRELLKEVQWMGEAFAVKHFVGAVADAVGAEATLLTSVAHPNVARCWYCFHDEDKREFFLVMDQLMTKDLASHVKEVNSAKRPVPFPLTVVVDVMLQIARCMEYPHSRKIYHGDLNPSNVLVRTRHGDSPLHVKVAVGQASAKAANAINAAVAAYNPCIWYAPEVLEQEATGDA
ncbi:light-sensor Protein kinase-like, partial [Miscanthus floridulus]|uniref:light-sensor Protein kinase-like n=1 Tax=Miscanthus floridulus TaxID=154761 RepID=UPI003458D1A1